jgi:anaphase-promoting complex subunit 10
LTKAELEDHLLEDDPFPPPGLKEISSLASWTVSTAKPGNGVAALRSPDTSLFWQSDGPQPHLLSIHFFKLVAIVHMRIFLDFQNDESYTPTKIQFLAGMGVHDIQEFAEMSFDRPTGWIDVDFSSIGPIQDDDEDDENEDEDAPREIDWSKRPVLRAFLVQVRILENHQNGKDTHLRAVQLFARDTSQEVRRVGDEKVVERNRVVVLPSHMKRKTQQTVPNNIKLAAWMMEPDLR